MLPNVMPGNEPISSIKLGFGETAVAAWESGWSSNIVIGPITLIT